MDKSEVVLQLTLKLLENFDYSVEDYSGNTLIEHAELSAKVASKIFNEIYNDILKDE